MGIRTFDDIRRLMESRTKETAALDFKRSLPEKSRNSDWAKDLAAMSNSGGGTLVYGVGERHSRADSLHPFPLTGAAERVSSVAQSSVDEPLVLADIIDVPFEGGDEGFLVVVVEQDDRVPYLVEGQAWGRSGPKNVTLTRAQVGRLFAVRGGAFLEEYGVKLSRPARVTARIESEKRQKGIDPKGKVSYQTHNRLVLHNRGEEDAHNLAFEFVPPEGQESPAVMNASPVKNLAGGGTIDYVLSFHTGTSLTQDVKLRWFDDDGGLHESEQTVSVS